MDIVNKENYMTNEQIHKILSILGKEHTPRRIVIYEKKLDVLSYRINNLFSLKEQLPAMGLSGDYYNIFNDTIHLIVDKKEEDMEEMEDKQFNLIRDLAYLIKERHYYNDYLKESDVSLVDAFSLNDINYIMEILADGRYDGLIDKFVTDFMNDNSKIIKEIMNWEEESELEE